MRRHQGSGTVAVFVDNMRHSRLGWTGPEGPSVRCLFPLQYPAFMHLAGKFSSLLSRGFSRRVNKLFWTIFVGSRPHMKRKKKAR